MRDPERWWQTFKRAMLYALIVGAALGLLMGCASAPKRGPCSIGPCGEECCNDDGKLCCPERYLWDGPPLPTSEERPADD